MPYNYVERETTQDLICPFMTAKLLLDMHSGKRVSSPHHALLVENVFDKMVSEILMKVSQIPYIGLPPCVTRHSVSHTATP